MNKVLLILAAARDKVILTRRLPWWVTKGGFIDEGMWVQCGMYEWSKVEREWYRIFNKGVGKHT